MIDGQIGFIRSDLLNVMTQAESDEAMAGVKGTPVPPMTAAELDAVIHPAETPTEAPTEAPAPEPAEIEEEVDLDEEVEDIEGSVAMNDDGAPMEWVALDDGVPVSRTPRLQRKGGLIRVSLDDLAACLDSWVLTDNGSALVLEANGYVLAIYNEDAGLSATVGGVEIPMDAAEFGFVEEGHFISADFLARALNGTAEWDEEEKTLMLRLPNKETANASD